MEKVLRFAMAACMPYLVSSLAMASPLPSDERMAAAPGAVTQVTVRRIEQMQPISTTAPPPRPALGGKHRLLVWLVEADDATVRGGARDDHCFHSGSETIEPGTAEDR